jgi:cyanophycin synthetase
LETARVLRLETYRPYFWRNPHALQPVFLGTVLFADAFHWTTQSLSPAVLSALKEKMPGVFQEPGPIGAPEFVARLAQEIELLADVTPSSCGVASRDAPKCEADVFFSYRDPCLAPRSLSLAVQVTDRLVQSDVGPERLARMLKSCSDMAEATGLERRTREMIEAAVRRNIPWIRPTYLVRHVQLGQGSRQQRFWISLFSPDSSLGRDYARNKLLTLNILEQIRLPVGRVEPVRDAESALLSAKSIGYPLVLKPADGMQGDSVYVDLRDEAELRAALDSANIQTRQYLLQSLFEGDDHRLLVVKGKLVAAARRIPASVLGDGQHSIAELVEMENRNPKRTSRATMAPIVLDGESDRILARQGSTRETIPDAGRAVRVKATANISTGGTSINVMDIIHPDNAHAAVRAARAVGLTVAGVDFICPDISKSWHEVGGGICEVNTTVGLRPHFLATPELDICGQIIEAFYPKGDEGRIPTAMVTGTFGKTTTTLMLASILSCAGHTVGSATTESVRIGHEDVAYGDLAGADGASIILRDATVTAAVLETARGGIIKTGMYLDQCDVAALLNVEREQIGMDGVETLDDMAAVKRKVLDAARRAVVLNADDHRCLALAPEFTKKVRTFLFSRDAGWPALREHLTHGGDALFLAHQEGHETITIASGADAAVLLRTADILATRDGLFWQHSSNAMAAAALAIGLGIDLDAIREGLRRYGGKFRPASCRLAFGDGFPVEILFDYAASPPAFAATITATRTIPVSGRRYCVATVPGNRPNWVFAESAAALAGHFQRYIFFELEDYRRGRNPGEIVARLSDATLAAGADPASVSGVGSHKEAAEMIAREARPGDLVVVFGMDKPAIVEQYRVAFLKVKAGGGHAPAAIYLST